MVLSSPLALPLVGINKWLYRLSVRTDPSQGSKPGSIPGRVTNNKRVAGRRPATVLFIFSLNKDT